MILLKLFIGESKPGHDAGPKAFDQNVGPLGEGLQQASAARGFQVQGDATLVAVEVEKQAAVFGVGQVFKEGADAPGAVSDTGPFDLNDVGSVVGEELGAVWPCHVVSKVEDFDVFEELVHG